MPTRRVLTWIIFGLCALAVVEGLGWVTWQAIRLERLEREARADKQLQEIVGLALWRMESELTPILAQESRRRYYEYRPFFNPDRAYTRMWQELQPGEIMVNSPLLESPGPYIRLHFQVEPDGSITSPQAPTGNMRDLAESQYVDGEFIVYATGLLGELSSLVSAPIAGERLGQGDPSEPPPAGASGGAEKVEGQTAVFDGLKRADSNLEAGKASGGDYEQRQQVMKQALANEYPAQQRSRRAAKDDAPVPGDRVNAPSPSGAREETALGAEADQFKEESARKSQQGAKLAASQPAPAHHAAVEELGFEPAWLARPGSGETELVFRRRVRVDQQSMIQGFWLDWPAIRARLHERIADLLPGARVEPYIAAAGPEPARSRLLASVPAVLVCGPLPVFDPPGVSATHATLAVTWLAVLGAIGAIGVVLRKSMALSDRRGRFVSAVTHELRTPLTTFCLYTEMLADNMVKDEPTRRTYLDTLKGESRRLARIVENVLDYARLGQGRAHPNGHVHRLSVTQLLDRMRPVLERRAEQSGMTLAWEAPGDSGASCAADPQSVERILYNLVDNACKYAGESTDRRVHVISRLTRDGRRGDVLEVTVRDHGPGIPASERRRVFQSFHRSRRDEQGPKTGLGLGLALSRALAREIGGDLELVADREPGAALRLMLPVECHPAEQLARTDP